LTTGASLRVAGARSVLVEQSIQLSDVLRPAQSSGFAPLTIGFRF
jgi:hypothetical protein